MNIEELAKQLLPYFTGATPLYLPSGGSSSFEPLGAVAAHAVLTAGVHGLEITPGQVLTVPVGGTLGSAAFMDADGTPSDTFTINSDLEDVTAELILGRTTGGNATISWDGDWLVSDAPQIDLRTGPDSNLLLTAASEGYVGSNFWSQDDDGNLTGLYFVGSVYQFYGGPDGSIVANFGPHSDKFLSIYYEGDLRIASTTGETVNPLVIIGNPITLEGAAVVEATLKTEDHVALTTGWEVSHAGVADFRTVYSDELHARSFIADLEFALAGGQLITKSAAPLAAQFILPEAGLSANFVVDEFRGFTVPVFEDDDVVAFRQLDRTGALLDTFVAWGTVTYVSRDDVAKTQTYTFTRSTAPNAGDASDNVEPGAMVIDYGKGSTAFNGTIEMYAAGPADVGVPYISINTWTGHPASGMTEHARIGYIGDISEAGDWGMWAGNHEEFKWFLAGGAGVRVVGGSIELYAEGPVLVMKMDPDALSFAIGATLPSAYDTGIGIWMGLDDTDYKYRVGDPEGVRIQWTGAALELYDANLSIADGSIAIGATPPTDASHGTGIWIDQTGMYGLASDVLQAKFDAATGAITAGAGAVTMDVSGITVTAPGTIANVGAYKFGSSHFGIFGINTGAGKNQIQIQVDATTMLILGTDGATHKSLTFAGTELGFYNAAAVTQPTAVTDLGIVLSNLGLRVAGTAYPITTTGAVSLTGATNALSTITTYNTIATVNNGIPSEIYTTSFLNQTAAIAATTLYAVPVNGAGYYRVSWYAHVNRAASTSSTLGGSTGFQLKHTVGTVVKTQTFQYPSNSNTNSTATGACSDLHVAYCDASTNLQFLFGYTSSGGTTMRYDLYVTVEKL